MSHQATQMPDQAAIEALSSRLIELANMSGENAAKAEIARWAQANVAGLNRVPVTEFPFASVAAHILDAFGKFTEAFLLSEASLRRHGPDAISSVIINKVRSGALRGGFDAVFAKRPDLAKPQFSFMLDKLGDVVHLVDERAALDLLMRIEAIDRRRAGRQPLDARPTLIKLGVWGENFIESARRNALASALALGNVPALAGYGPVIVHLHTRARDAGRLRALAPMRELERYARIEIEIIPEELFIGSHMWGLGFWNRSILAMAEYDSLMYARRIGADMMCLGADMVLSDGCLKAVKDKLAAGYEVYLTSSLRAVDERISPLLDRYRDGPVLCVPADVLYRLSLDALHPVLLQQFMRQDSQRMPADPHQFFFTAADGFAAHAFQWHPLAFSARSVPENIGFDGQTIDCRFPSDLLAGKDRETTCYIDREPPGNGYMVGLDSAHGIAAFGNFEVSPAGVVRSLDKWINRAEDFDYFEWMVRQRAHYRVPPDVTLALPTDCRDEDGVIEEIIQGVEGQRAHIMQRIARYQVVR